MVAAPSEYRWSSNRVHAYGLVSDWLVAHPLYLQLGATPSQRQMVYRAICGEPLTDDELATLRYPKRVSVSGVSGPAKAAS